MTAALWVGFGLVAHAQTLLYQWAFTNSANTFTNASPSYAFTPGTGNLQLANVGGNINGLIGADSVNPMLYFTNAGAGPGSGPGVNANGALVANGQGYNSGNVGVAMATNLNLGNQFQITVCFWVKLGNLSTSQSVFGQFPRPVMFSALSAYDVGGKGAGNVRGLGFSYNNWITSPNANQLQNGIANGSGGAEQPAITITNIPAGNPIYPTGIAADGFVWYFEALTYDGTLTANNFIWWLGTKTTNVYPVVVRSDNYSAIDFSTNAYVFIGGNNVPSSPRALSSGAIADVRIYSGILNSNQLEAIRTFNTPTLIPPSLAAASISSGPNSGSTYVSGSRTFSVTASGNPAAFTYQWRSNSVAIPGATNSTLTLTNIQIAAIGAGLVCSVTNAIGGTNSPAAVLTVIAPVAGSYAQAAYALNPYSFWKVNEPTNSSSIIVSDFANGHDGVVVTPANMFFVAGPTNPAYPGFSMTNTAIETRPNIPSVLNLANPASFPNTGMTICGWVNTPGLVNGNGLIFDLVSDTGGGFGLQAGLTDGVNNYINYQWGQTSVASGLYFIPGEWTFIALTISTNLTQADADNFINADTNAIVYVGSPTVGFQAFTNSTALNGTVMPSGTSASPLALGRTTVAYSENGSFSAVSDAQFNSVAIYYQALSTATIANLYAVGTVPALKVTGVPDPGIPGNILLTWPVGILQEATAVVGPYTDVSGPPTSPYSVPMTGTQHYYRLRN
jgi:hypothetical protein